MTTISRKLLKSRSKKMLLDFNIKVTKEKCQFDKETFSVNKNKHKKIVKIYF